MKVIEPDVFYLFDHRFKFSIGLEQCLNSHTVTRGAIDLGIREDLMQISKSGFTDWEHKKISLKVDLATTL